MGDKRRYGKEEINAMNNLCEYVMSPQEKRETRERERENLGFESVETGRKERAAARARY